MKLRILTLLLSILLISSTLTAEKMTPEKLWSLDRISSVALSPDGKQISFTLTTQDFEENTSNSNIYIIPVGGGDMKRLTYSGTHNSSACWSPDSKKIGFISDRNGDNQGYILDLSGGDAKQLTNMDNGISFLTWSPSGKHLAFVSDVKLEQTIQEKNPDLPKVNALLYDDLPVRHWDEWIDEKYRHLFVINAVGGDPIDLMKKERFDTPLKPFGGMSQITWSAKGTDIAYTSKKVDNFESSTNSEIYTAPVYGGKSTNITKGVTRFPLDGFDFDPLYAPNGKYIAFRSQKRPGFEADKIRLLTYAIKTGRIKDLTEKFDNWVGKFVWSKDSRYIYFSAIEKGRAKIFKMNSSNGKYETILEGMFNYGDRFLSISPGGKTLYFSRRNFNNPMEICSMPTNGDEDDVKLITNVNTKAMKKIDKAIIKERWVETVDAQQVHCWVIYPPDFDSTKKYPLITYCQGGPQQAISQYWSYGWNFLLMASKGYIVLAPNRRGCPGYGQEWIDAISKDWGGKAMSDILDATDAMAAESYIDETKMAAIGGSAGGYAVFWLEGNHGKRFKAFVSHCGVFNTESMHGSTEELWFPDWDFNGSFLSFTAKKQYEKNSPHIFAENWDTPIFIITGEKDYRVPYAQSLQAFTLAQTMGITSKLLYYPNEKHWIVHPQEKILWYREFFYFLDTYCK